MVPEGKEERDTKREREEWFIYTLLFEVGKRRNRKVKYLLVPEMLRVPPEPEPHSSTAL
jgi:hypothetical protein